MSYSWMITYADLTDEVIKKFPDERFTTSPSATNNYYDMTAAKFISFAASYGISESSLSNLNRTTNPPNYLVIQWLITCFCMLVAQNLVGLNNDPMVDDKWRFKYQTFRDDLKTLSSKITYETLVSGQMQQNYTRSANTFQIMV
jgi:hypothetical protein